MYGLIKKDLLMIKQNIKLLIIVFMVFLSMSIVNESDMTFILPFMAVMISISTFSYDAYNKWDAYAITLPKGRKNVVRAKYISTLLFVGLSFLISLIAMYIMSKSNVNIDFSSVTEDLIGCLMGIFLIIIIMFPILYKFGVEKGRIALFLITFGVTGIAFLLSKNIKISIPTNIINFFNNNYQIIIPIIISILMVISYKVSEHIYAKKEF